MSSYSTNGNVTVFTVKESKDIEEYSFSQTTLEQAYLTICRGVEEED